MIESGLAVVVLLVPCVVGWAAIRTYLPGRRPWSSRQLRRLVGYGFLFAAVLGLACIKIVPHWQIQLDEEQDFIMGATCASFHGCPNFGNSMNIIPVLLPPLNRYILAAIHLFSPDPRLALSLLLILHALAAVWLAVIGDELFGEPFGWVAGMWFGTHRVLIDFAAAASNGAFAPIFVVGGLWGTLRWVRGEGAVPFLVAVTCLTCAGQLHGTHLLAWAAFALVAILFRPPLPRRALWQAALIVGVMYLPSIWHALEFFGPKRPASVSVGWAIVNASMTERVQRVVASMSGVMPVGSDGSMKLAAFCLFGAIAIASGLKLPAPQRRAARALLPFFLLPLSATMAAGSGWVPRYGIGLIPSAALCAAGGVHLLAMLPSIDARPTASLARLGAGVLLVTVWTALSSGDDRYDPRLHRRTGMLLNEQIEAIRIMGEHQLRAPDLEMRVHGLAWNHWEAAPAYLGNWILGYDGEPSPAEDILITEGCEAPSAFASWQRALTWSDGSLSVVGYKRALAPIRLDIVDDRGTTVWSRDAGIPFYGQMAVYVDMDRWRRRLDPRIGYPDEIVSLPTVWTNTPGRQFRLSTTLAAGAGDRILTLLYDDVQQSKVMIGGRVREPIQRDDFGGTIGVRERYRVTADERTAELPLAVILDLADSRIPPHRIDLFEEPEGDCGGPTSSARLQPLRVAFR